MKTTLFTKILGLLIILGAVGGGLYFSGMLDESLADVDSIIPGSGEDLETDDGAKTINIGVVTWGGYAGGQYFNEGFNANVESRFYKKYGFQVQFKLIDNFVASREAWKSGAIDLLWATVDAFPTEATSLSSLEPVFLFQADWSRGGDAIVVRKGIQSVEDLKGRTIAVAYKTPSHSFLINMIEGSNLKYSDIEVVKVADAIDAAAAFKSGKVDAAVVWSPDDVLCVDAVRGSSVLASTKTATHIIADGFFAKREWLNNNREIAEQLYEGWMTGASEINSSAANKQRAAQILSKGLNLPEGDCMAAMDNVRLATHGDNMNFFGLNESYTGVTGDQLYSLMTDKYKELGFIKSNASTYWRSVSDISIIKSGESKLYGAVHESELGPSFTAPSETDYTMAAISTKSVSVTFPSGSYALGSNAQSIIDLTFVNTAQQFAGARIRVEGNTDATGNAGRNQTLSKQRAQSVVDYLVKEYGFDANRFVVVGNGPANAIKDGVTGANEDYRRTDFELLPN